MHMDKGKIVSIPEGDSVDEESMMQNSRVMSSGAIVSPKVSDHTNSVSNSNGLDKIPEE